MVRLDFPDGQGGYSRSVVLHGRTYKGGSDWALPWGKPSPDQTQYRRELDTGREMVLDIRRLAPVGWSGAGAVLSLMLEGTAPNRHVVLGIRTR